MGAHEISIKSIFDFRKSLPINEILYTGIQYINTYIQQIHYLFPGKYYRRQHPPKNDHYDIIEILLNKDVFVQPVTLVEQELPTPFVSPWEHPRFFVGIRAAHLFSFLCVGCLRSVSCVPNIASVSGLSILDFR